MMRFEMIRILGNSCAKGFGGSGCISLGKLVQSALREFFGSGWFRLSHNIL